MAFFIILGIVLWIFLAFWPAFIARRKGYSFLLFLLVALIISWLLALIIVLLLKDKTQTDATRAADKAAEQELDREEAR